MAGGGDELRLLCSRASASRVSACYWCGLCLKFICFAPASASLLRCCHSSVWVCPAPQMQGVKCQTVARHGVSGLSTSKTTWLFEVKRRRRRTRSSLLNIGDVTALHATLSTAVWIHSTIVIPVHSRMSSVQRLLGLPLGLVPSKCPSRAGRHSVEKSELPFIGSHSKRRFCIVEKKGVCDTAVLLRL